MYKNPAGSCDGCNRAPLKKLAKSFIHKMPMCDFCSNYRARQPQLIHCFSSVSLLINESLVITGFMRWGVKTLAGPHSTLLSTSMKASNPASSIASCLLQLLFFTGGSGLFLIMKGKNWCVKGSHGDRTG